jgi:hypothetical protein
MRFLAGITCFLLMCAAAPRAFAQTRFLPLPDSPKPPVRRSRLDGILYLASEGYLVGGTWLDASTTVKGLEHPTMAYRGNGSFLMRYVVTENGWARCMGNRDAFGVTAANVALNLGVWEASRRLFRRGGRWRILAIGLVVAKATASTWAGVHNIGLEAGINQKVRKATGYRGAIVWR